MNEKDIADAVAAVLASMKQDGEAGSEKADVKKHVCKCSKKRMTLALANALIEKVREYAKEVGVQAVIAVSDAAGRPVSVQCMDDAYIASYDIAVNKTFTSASLKMPTSVLAKLCQPGADLYGLQYTNGGKIVIFGGGELLKYEDTIIGALGVSGGSAEQDTKIAEYGRDIFKEVVACL